jgi:hypothetical protein
MLTPEVVGSAGAMVPANQPLTSVDGVNSNGGLSPSSSSIGRVWRWIQKHPSWTPVISTVTGAGLVAFYGTTALVALIVTGVGLVGSVGSSLIPGEETSHRLREFSAIMTAEGVHAIGVSARSVLRGCVSAVPIVGNGIVYFVDKHNGINEETLFGIHQMILSGEPLPKRE